MADRKKRKLAGDAVLVIGLGRFGAAVAHELVRQRVEVLAVDADLELVQKWADELTHVVQADGTDEQVLRELGVGDFGCAVVGVGSNIEASVIATLILAQAGVPEIWAKAQSTKHGNILERVGATNVVYPERQTGQRVAHMVAGAMKEWMEFDDGYAIARTTAPRDTWGKPLSESAPRSRFGVTVIGVKRRGQDFVNAVPTTVVEEGDELVLSGATDKVEEFCRQR